MSSYRGLDWKIGATRQLRPLRRDAAVLSWPFKGHSKLASSKNTPLPFGKMIDSSSNSNNRLGLAAGAGVTLLFRFFSRASRRYCSTITRLIPSRYRPRQVFNLSNLNNIGYSPSSPTRWLPNFRRLHTAHPEPSL